MVTPPVKRFWIPLLTSALLVGHFLWLSRYVTCAYASPDADGYFAQARLMAEEHRVSFRPESDLQYVGVHWLEVEDKRFISRYPPGLPAILAATWKVGGRDATFWVNPALCTLTLLFLFLLARPWVGEQLALVAALVFAAHPLANYHAIHADSHTAATFFLVAGLWALDAWSRNPSRPKALGAGALLGIVPTIRPAEGAAALGIAVFLGWMLARKTRGVPFAVLGAALPVGLLLAHNWSQLGSPFLFGYALTNEQQSLSLANFEQNWELYLDTLMGTGGAGLFFAVGLAGLCGMLAQAATRPLGICVLLVISGISFGYSLYYWSGSEGMIARFLLPTMPLFLVPALWFFRLHGARRVARYGLLALVVITLGRNLPDSIERLRSEHEGAARTSEALAWIEENVPAGSILVAERRLQDYLHFTGKWRLADGGVLLGSGGGFGFGGPGGLGRGNLPRGRTLRGVRRQGAGNGRRPGRTSGRPSPMQRGKAEEMRRKYRELPPGERSIVAVNDLLDWAGDGGDVYWIGSRREIQRFDELVAGAEKFERVGEFELSRPPRETREQGRRGLGGALGMLRGWRRDGMASMFHLRPGTREVFKLKR